MLRISGRKWTSRRFPNYNVLYYAMFYTRYDNIMIKTGLCIVYFSIYYSTVSVHKTVEYNVGYNA